MSLDYLSCRKRVVVYYSLFSHLNTVAGYIDYYIALCKSANASLDFLAVDIPKHISGLVKCKPAKYNMTACELF